MSTRTQTELLVERDGERVLLLAPDVGVFTDALPEGAALAPGQTAGTLLRLGRPTTLVVPPGVAGSVRSARPERVHEPVGYRSRLYTIAPFRTEDAAAAAEDAARSDGGLALPSPQSGRFYHRPAPGEPAFVAEGDLVEDGRPVGLIEVMKTFTHVVYRAQGGLPPRARIVRLVAGDGVDVSQGEALVEVEPA